MILTDLGNNLDENRRFWQQFGPIWTNYRSSTNLLHEPFDLLAKFQIFDGF